MTETRWLPFLLLCFMVGVLARSPILVTFAVSLAVVVQFARWWRNHALDGIHYTRRLTYRRMFPGEKTPLRIDVENRKLLPVPWLKTEDFWADAVAPVETAVMAPSHIEGISFLVNLFSLRWYERIHRNYTLLFRKRGVYPVGPVMLESGDLFGMYEKQVEIGTTEYLTVFPETLPPTALNLQAEDPFGDRRSRRRLFEDPNRPIGIREYQPEDEFRRVHWPATAHTGSLQVKVYQPVSSQVMMVCLNVSTLAHSWEGFLPNLLEHLIKVAATITRQGMESGYAVGLISNGYLAHADQPFRVPPGRSPRQLARLFEMLAGVTPLTTTPFERYLLHATPSIPYGATLVIITSQFTPELSRTLLRLKRYRLHKTVFSLAVEPPPEIPGVSSVHMPFVEVG